MAMPIATVVPPIVLPTALDADVSADEARMKLVRGRLDISGPTTAARIAQELGLAQSLVVIALEQLETELLLQQLELAAHTRLRGVQLPRRRRDVQPILVNRDQIAQLLELHGVSI